MVPPDLWRTAKNELRQVRSSNSMPGQMQPVVARVKVLRRFWPCRNVVHEPWRSMAFNDICGILMDFMGTQVWLPIRKKRALELPSPCWDSGRCLLWGAGHNTRTVCRINVDPHEHGFDHEEQCDAAFLIFWFAVTFFNSKHRGESSRVGWVGLILGCVRTSCF